jgi:hypothetical protein
MPNSIRDGKGRGYLLSVTQENRGLVSATSVPLRTHISMDHGQSYSTSTGVHTLNTINTWHWILFWKVTSIDKNFHVDTISVSWNGGSTNFNRPLEICNVLPTAGQPTGNQVLRPMSNNNKNVNNVAEMDSWIWDGVGDGMTNNAGPCGGTTFHSQGLSEIKFNGAVVTGLNESVGLQVRSPEIGDFSIGFGGYFIDKEANV